MSAFPAKVPTIKENKITTKLRERNQSRLGTFIQNSSKFRVDMLNVDLQNYNMRKGIEERVVSTNEECINLFNRLEEKSLDIREHMRLDFELK